MPLSELIKRPPPSGREPAFLALEEAKEESEDDDGKIIPAESILSKLGKKDNKNRLNLKLVVDNSKLTLPSLKRNTNGTASQREFQPMGDLSPKGSMLRSQSNSYLLGPNQH